MRKVVALGAAVLIAGSVSIAMAQERLPQHSGFGTGVGENAGVGSRSQIWDRAAFLEYLSQPETIYGRVLAIDIPAGKMLLETGGSSHDEGRAGAGTLAVLTAYFDDKTNMDQIRVLNAGDDISLQVVEATTANQPFGTGRKMVRQVTVIRGNEKLAGFGGLGQRPNPYTERGIETQNLSVTGGVIGQVLPGEINTGIVSPIGEVTGAAPCWQCEPQPGWGYGSSNKSDYGTDPTKPNLVKGIN